MDQTQIKNMTNKELRDALESIQEELNEREWDDTVKKPDSMKRAIELARKAKQEHVEGKTTMGGFV